MSLPRLLLVAAVLSAGLAACGRAGESTAETMAEQALRAQQEAGTAGTGEQDGQRRLDLDTSQGRIEHTVGDDVPMPDDFPRDVVLPQQYVVVSVMRLGPSRSLVLRSPEPVSELAGRLVRKGIWALSLLVGVIVLLWGIVITMLTESSRRPWIAALRQGN